MTLSQLLLQRHLTGLKVGRGHGPGRSLTPGTPVPPPYLVWGHLPTLRGTVRRRALSLLTKEESMDPPLPTQDTVDPDVYHSGSPEGEDSGSRDNP